eukprot:6204034-Pleurochrysis_carterae.AAC.6
MDIFVAVAMQRANGCFVRPLSSIVATLVDRESGCAGANQGKVGSSLELGVCTQQHGCRRQQESFAQGTNKLRSR